ncbi:MAG: asparagine--tRNA ligase [Mycoplasma sp.]|nr:asparagine--tRNA ligase [Mycoplasma sp.]
MTIKQILQIKEEQKIHKLQGWARFTRGNEKIFFIELNDGSTISNLQLVIKNPKEEILKIKKGDSLEVSGILILTPLNQQKSELKVDEIIVINPVDNDYPIQKQHIPLETLREKLHVRHQTKTLQAIMLIRSTLSKKIHEFFDKHNYLYLHSPIITSNDGEGAGETFEIKNNIFSNKANLTVTGQLHAEAYANGFKKIYTFGPTFRAEKSHTPRHASEFWMVEPEVAFYKLNDIMDMSYEFLSYITRETIKLHKEEFDLLDSLSENKLLNNINLFLNTKPKIITYKDCIEILEKEKDIFNDKNIHFGLDLATEHEKYLTKKLGPIFIINYPKEIKAFYMYQNDDKKTVACFDFLVPGIGELIGGSQRENRYDVLLSRIEKLGLDFPSLEWYLDLRRFGAPVSSGFGLGFERMIMYLTGIHNIRDVIPFPRTTGMVKM